MKVFAFPLLVFLFHAFAAAQREPIVVYLAGDSTMAEKRPEKRPETGWGEFLQRHFRPEKVRIENRAQNGRSTKSFINEGRWQAIVDDLKKGDYVFIQFGHNDASKDKGERYTTPADYRKNLIRFVTEARSRGAHLVLLTPIVRRRFNEKGEFYDTHGEYPAIVRAVAAEYRVPLVDLHRASEKLLVEQGAAETKKLFLHLSAGENANYPHGIEDNTHFSPRGAEAMARLAIEGLRTAEIELAKHLLKK